MCVCVFLQIVLLVTFMCVTLLLASLLCLTLPGLLELRSDLVLRDALPSSRTCVSLPCSVCWTLADVLLDGPCAGP